MYPLKIDIVSNESQLEKLLKFIETMPQDYPDFNSWVYGKCKNKIENGVIKAIYAEYDGEIMGNALYQELDDSTIEIKNFRIDPLYQNRDLGRYLINQVASDNPKSEIKLDTSIDNFQGIKFFIHNDFEIIDRKSLYQKDKYDYLMIKPAKKK